MAICVFCTNRADSKEDVWPLWILELVKTKEPIRRKIGKNAAIVTPNQDIKIKSVCKTCNNGWMSNLENECKPLLKSLIQDTTQTLNQSQQELIALWAMKTGMILDSIKKAPSSRFFTRSECQTLREHRTVPSGTQIWIGRFEEIGLFYDGADLSRIKSSIAVPDGKSDDFIGTVSTLLLDHLILQTLTLRPTATDSERNVAIQPHFSRWEELLSAIWPSSSDAFSWPLNLSFSNSGKVPFGYLVYRWSGFPKTIHSTSS